MRDAVKNYLSLASGFTEVTRQRAMAAAKALVSSGEATAEQVSNLADELLTTSRNNRDAVLALIRYEIDRALNRMGLATADEVASLQRRVTSLESAVRTRSDDGGGAQPAKKAQSQPAKKAQSQPAKKAQSQPAKKAQSQPAKKAQSQPAKKAQSQPAKKAQSQPAKKSAQKSAAKKAPAKSSSGSSGSSGGSSS